MRSALRTALCSAVVGLLVAPPVAVSQSVQYAYDAAGRLHVVGDARGDLAVYDYDAVGNVLAIRRIAVASRPEPVVVALVVPGAARPGAAVSIFGKGFGATARDNVVTINGVPTSVVTAAPTRLMVRVPGEVTSGAVRVSAPLGDAVWSESFRVLGVLGIVPAAAIVAPGGGVHFTVVGADAAAVRWSVDGVAGGDAIRGTITADGLYVAPATSGSRTVRVAATSLDDAAIEAAARVTITGSRPTFVASAPVGIGRTVLPPRFVVTAPLTVTAAPVVSAVVPSEGARGDVVRLTVNGSGLEGATRLEFLAGRTADPALVVSDLTVEPDGRSATAQVAIAATAAAGPRIVRVHTPDGASTSAVVGDNVFTVR
jgi:hypothetical protein